MKEASRYLQNAKEILKKAPSPLSSPQMGERGVRGGLTRTAYLAILKAIDEYLWMHTQKGVASILTLH